MKKGLFLVLFFFALLNENLKSQSWTWDAPTSVINAQKTICPDASGNLYMYGNSFLLNWSGDPDTIIKVSPAGQLLSQIVLPSGMRMVSLIAAPDTGVYIGGTFHGTLSFANSTYTSQGASDIWVTRYSKNGTLLWMKTVASPGEDYLGALCMNSTSLILTGIVADTVNFMGQIVPKTKSADLFVGVVNSNGVLQHSKFAKASHSPTLAAFSGGQECKADGSGNIYVLAYGAGLNKIDTFRISHAGQYDDQIDRNYCQAIIKFNNFLQPQFVSQVYQCFHFCYPLNNLQVSSSGESYLMNLYSYGQSGNDDLWSTIYKYSNTGTAAGKYRLRPERNSVITDIALDCFDNLYFTGYSRPETNHIDPHAYSFAVGKFTPSFTIDWLKQDSLHEGFVSGNSIVAFGKNDVFVNGVFRDTVQLLSTITTTASGGGFFARMTSPDAVSCAQVAPNTTALAERFQSRTSLYPNPTSGLLFIEAGQAAQMADVYSADGKFMTRAKVRDHTFDVSYLKNGLYFVHIINEGKTSAIKKIIINK